MRAIGTLVYILGAFGGTAIAAARAAPSTIRWWRRRRARIDSAERVARRLALRDEIQRHLPAKTNWGNRGEAIIRDVHRVDEYPDIDDRERGISSWFKVELKDEYQRGLEVFCRSTTCASSLAPTCTASSTRSPAYRRRRWGTQAVSDATDLRTLKQVAHLIDQAILTQASANDALELPQPPFALKPRPRPRQLIADAALNRRRAAGEPLRQLASDYQVAQTTLSRYFARTEINRQLQHTRRQLRAQRRARTAGRRSAQPPPDSNHAAQPHN